MVVPAEEVADGGVVGVVGGPVQGGHLPLSRAVHVRVALSIQYREKGQETMEAQQGTRVGGWVSAGECEGRVVSSAALPLPLPAVYLFDQ